MNTIPAWWRKPRRISVVVDNESWVLPYAEQLIKSVRSRGDHANLVRQYEDVPDGSVAFYLGCVKITPVEVLALNHRNLVIHASDLPKGRGFSPLTWLILSGENRIPVCLIEAAREVDTGPVIYKQWINFQGHELNAEMREKLGKLHVDLCMRFLNEVGPPEGELQSGHATIYARRRPSDSRLDPHKTIFEQFDLMRVVDNKNYPAFFDMRGHEYVLRIEKRGLTTKK